MPLVALQFKARPTKHASLAAMSLAIERHPDSLVVLPEMAAVGYDVQSREHALTLAEPADGPTSAALSAAARSARSWVVAGFAERASDQVYNAALVIDPSGQTRFVYRKTLLFEADHWATPGDSGYPVIDTPFGRLGVGICMDLNDDAFLAHAAANRVDVIAFPTNWVQEEGEIWDYWRYRLHRGWPLEFGIEGAQPDRAPVDAVLIAANSYGTEGAYELRGQSAILTRWGVHAAAPARGDHPVLWVPQ